MKLKLINNKGQAFTVFKMLIGLAFAMALLGLIYQATSNITCPSPGFKELETLVLQASRAPDKCFERTICFDKHALIEKNYYQSSIGVSVSFHDDAFHPRICSGSSCSFPRKLSTPVSVTCSSHSLCNVYLGESCSS